MVKPLSKLAEDITLVSPYGKRQIYKTITYHASPEVDKKILEVYFELLEKVKTVKGIEPCIVLHPTPVGHTGQMTRNGGNPLGIAGESPLTIMQTSWAWIDKEDDASQIQANDELFERATQIAKDAGKHIPYIYQNYAWGNQDVFAGYGKENLERLQKIQKKIDPDGIFAGGEGLSRGYFKVNLKSADAAKERDEL